MLIGGSTGFFLNAWGPFRDGAWHRLARAATWGVPAAAIGGALGLVLGERVIGLFQGGLLGRACSWAVLGLGIGLGQGLADRSRQRLVFGLLGGGLGGFVGGYCFEALRVALGNRTEMGQALGIVILGAGLGLFLALVEQALRRAWVQVQNGRQEGRTYLLAHRRCRLGLDERAEVGIFGDPGVARQHAEIEATSRGLHVPPPGPPGLVPAQRQARHGNRAAPGRRSDRAGPDGAGVSTEVRQNHRGKTTGQERWVLEVVRGRDVGKRYVVGPGESLLGNALAGASGFDLADQEPSSPRRMAARQASLTATGDVLEIRDLESPGGTFVNRQRLLSGQARALQPGDLIQLGGVQLQVRREADAGTGPRPQPAAPARATAPAPAPAKQRPGPARSRSPFRTRSRERALAGPGTTS